MHKPTATRPGANNFNLELVDFQNAITKTGEGTRLRVALESAIHTALHPEKASSSLLSSMTQADEPRVREYLRIRASLGVGGGEKGESAASLVTPAVSDLPTMPGVAVGEGGSVFSPWIAPHPPMPDIPLLLPMARCELGCGGASALATVLSHRTCTGRVVYLDLSANTLTDLGRDFRGLRPLLTALRSLPHLAFLSLANNMLLGRGARCLRALLIPPTGARLTHLDLSRANLNGAGAAALLGVFRRGGSGGGRGLPRFTRPSPQHWQPAWQQQRWRVVVVVVAVGVAALVVTPYPP